MSEPTIIELTHTGAAGFDGITPIELRRDDFAVKDQRFYSATIEAGGVIPADFWGLFTESEVKVVAIACESLSSRSVARVAASNGAPDVYRQEVDLTPAFQSVFTSATDLIRLRVPAPGAGSSERNVVTLIVNVLNERQAADYSKSRLPNGQHRRYRVLRTDGVGFILNPTSHLLPQFEYLASTQTMVAMTDVHGFVSVREIARPGSDGVYVWARFTGIAGGTGDVYLIDARTGEEYLVDAGLVRAKWSTPFWVSRDDRIGFRSSNPPDGYEVAVELSVGPTTSRRF